MESKNIFLKRKLKRFEPIRPKAKRKYKHINY